MINRKDLSELQEQIGNIQSSFCGLDEQRAFTSVQTNLEDALVKLSQLANPDDLECELDGVSETIDALIDSMQDPPENYYTVTRTVRLTTTVPAQSAEAAVANAKANTRPEHWNKEESWSVSFA